MAEWLLSCFVAMCVERCVLATWCCKTHCNGCMNVAWGLCWQESRGTKPSVFPCKVAAAGDERYLMCAAGAAAVVSRSNRFLLCVLQRVVVHVCVILCVCWLSGGRSQWSGCMIVVVFCNSISADRIVAVLRLLGATAACARLFLFAAGHRKSYWSGCIKAAIVICWQMESILCKLCIAQ